MGESCAIISEGTFLAGSSESTTDMPSNKLQGKQLAERYGVKRSA